MGGSLGRYPEGATLSSDSTPTRVFDMMLPALVRWRTYSVLVCLVVLGPLARPASSQVPLPLGRPFSGSIQCRIETTGTGYSDKQVHTWTLTEGVPSTVNTVDGTVAIHPAQWSASGDGSLDYRSSGGNLIIFYHDGWKMAAGPIDASIALRIRGSDLAVELWHTPAVVTDGISGAFSRFGDPFNNGQPEPWKEPAREAPLPTMQGSRTGTSLSGTTTAKLTGTFVPHRQPNGSEVVETCTWQLAPAAQSNVPPPPPPPQSSNGSPAPQTGTIAGGRIDAPVRPRATDARTSTEAATPAAAATPTVVTTPALFTTPVLLASLPDGPWSGQVRCELDVQQAGYARHETQTWTLTGEKLAPNGVMRIYGAMWTYAGSGKLERVQDARTVSAHWEIKVPPTPAPFAFFIRASDQKLIIRLWHAQKVLYDALSGTREITVNGKARPPEAIKQAVSEWQLPWFDVAPSPSINASVSVQTEGLGAELGQRGRPPSAMCTYQFSKTGDAQSPGATPISSGASGTLSAISPTSGSAVAKTPAEPPSTNQPPVDAGIATRAPGAAVPAAPPGATAVVGATGGVTLSRAAECATTGPAATTTVTPGGVSFRWPQLAGATGYAISRSDIGSLTAAPITALSYTHAAALDYRNTPYKYAIAALYSDGKCAITNVTVTAPKPVVPRVTPTVTPGEQTSRVNLTWGDQADHPTSYLVLGPGLHEAGAEVTAGANGQALDIDKLPAGNLEWLVMPFWRTPTGIMSDVSNAARVTATVTVTSGKYQIFIAGFRVNNQTYDDPVNRDGWVDEIYAAASVAKWEGGAVKSNEVAKSWVYGDANASGRIRAGSGSGNGGLKAGDVVPSGWSPSSAQLPPETDAHRFPMKVWEGTLRIGDVLSVRPTLWEFDGDSGAYEYWRAWALSSPTWGSGLASPGLAATKGPSSPLYQFASAAQFADPGEALDAAFERDYVQPTAADGDRFDKGMKKTAGRFWPGKDRIVGLDGYVRDMRGLFVAPTASGSTEEFDYSRIHWVDRQVAFTREKIEAALNAPGSQGFPPGVIAISLVDEDHNPLGPLHGDYTLYLRVVRMP